MSWNDKYPVSEAAHFWSIGKCMKFLSEVMRMLIVVMTLFYLWLHQPHKKPSINTHWTVHKSCTCYCWPASPAKIVLIICVNHIVYILYPSKAANEKREKKNTTTKPIQPVWQESVLVHCWTLVSGASSGSFGFTAESSPAHFREYSRKNRLPEGGSWARWTSLIKRGLLILSC